eukprot:6157670-Pleurochrysis_carterae.AAC.1
MAEHRAQDQSFYGDCFYSTPKRKATRPPFACLPTSNTERLVPFVNVWPDPSICDLETWREA